MTQENGTTLVIGGTGKTGRRVVERLEARGLPVRIGSRSGAPPFRWEDPATWEPVLRGARRAYVSFHPDLAVPGAAEAVGALAALAARTGVRRLVLLSGRGEEEAQRAEREVQRAGLGEWAVVRCSFFAQNFSESVFLDGVLGGEVVLPETRVPEPFVDLDDVADAAVAVLTEDGLAGRVHELTGPRAIGFGEAVAEVSAAIGRPVRYTPVPVDDYLAGMRADGQPPEVVELIGYLFTEVMDGRNARPTDGVRRVLGREARDFRAYARRAAAAGAWAA